MSDRYEIREEIGKGGLGAVYKAFDNQLHREVAMKRVLTTEQGSEEEVEAAANNLIAEAQTLSSLNHPNIVTVFDIGRDEKGGFVVMELLKGETLDETVERGVLTQDDFIEVVHQTMEALIAAQAANVLHRDLKPTNVMVIWQPSGKFQTKILDFGLAKFSKTPSVQTMDQEDAVMGSIYFMAPEQFERAHLDQRSDLYQIGCVYYHALTGQYPFRGETGPQVMNAHLQHRVTPLEKLRPDLSPSVCQWVMWLINREMDNRPASAQEALDRFPKNPEPPGEAVLQAIPVEESTADESLTTGVQVVVPHAAKPPPKLIVTGSAPVAPGAAKFHRHGRSGAALDPETKKKRLAVAGTIVAVIALVAVGLYFFNSAKANNARQTLSKLASQEAPKGGVKEVALALRFLDDKKATAQEKTDAIATLSKLQGTGVDAAIIEALRESQSSHTRWRLSQVLAERGRAEAVPAMMNAFARSSSGTMKMDILNSIRRIAGPENAEAILDTLTDVRETANRTRLESILLAIYRKQPIDGTVVDPLLARISNAEGEELGSLYRVLGALGSDDILTRLRSDSKDPNRIRRLGAMEGYQKWPDRTALKQLGELIREGAGGDTLVRSRALDAYSRIAGLPAAVPADEKIAAWKQVLGWSKVVSDYQNVFAGAIDNPSANVLAFSREYQQHESQSLSSWASKAVAEIEKYQKEAPVLGADGRLDPGDAHIRGNTQGAAQVPVTDSEGNPVDPPRTFLTGWNSRETWFVWHFKVEAAGEFGVEVLQSHPDENPSEFEVIIGDRAIGGASKRTESWTDFEPVTLEGTFSLEPETVHSLFLRARGVTQPRMMDIRAVRLVAR